jgi:octaprenyl-diphosphate synthase
MGLNLGITFQVVDDILDYAGDQRELGKEVCADLREGRVTLPLIHALAQASPGDRERLAAIAQDLTPELAPELRSLIDKYGSLDYARTVARNYTLKAQENLKTFPASREKTYFWAITEELLARTH